MKEITVKITEQGSKDALASLSKADKSERYAKWLKAQLVAYHHPARNPTLDALRVLIAFALVNPGGHIERILRKRGFMTPELY
jgi:hypothetical protein